jgi:hypothetical protein
MKETPRGFAHLTENEPVLFGRSQVYGASIFYCEAREQGAEILDYRTDVQLYSPSWAFLRSRGQDDSFRRRRDVFFTQAIPEGSSRGGNAPLEFGPPRCRRLLRTVGWKMRLPSQCIRTMPTGCVLRFVSFVGPIGRLLWCRTFLSLKPGGGSHDQDLP